MEETEKTIQSLTTSVQAMATRLDQIAKAADAQQETIRDTLDLLQQQVKLQQNLVDALAQQVTRLTQLTQVQLKMHTEKTGQAV